MSGGAFDYKQTHIKDIIDGLERRLRDDGTGLSDKTRHEFRIGLSLLRMAFVYADEIDLLLSDDTGEDTFHERLHQKISCLDLSDVEIRLRGTDAGEQDGKGGR